MGRLKLKGTHRVLCDDCTLPENVSRLMAGEKADMVFTDPPYNLASHANLTTIEFCESPSINKLSDSAWDKNFDIKKALPSIDLAASENCSVYICTSEFLCGDIFEWASKANGKFHGPHLLVWCKPNPMVSLMKRHWTWAIEMIAYTTRGKHTFNFPEEGHALSWWQFNKNPKNDLHPTMKPIQIPEHAIKHSSNAGHIVADLFLGSGSTLIACEKTNRRCFGCEIEPLYIDVILSRYKKFCGKPVVREDGVEWEN